MTLPWMLQLQERFKLCKDLVDYKYQHGLDYPVTNLDLEKFHLKDGIGHTLKELVDLPDQWCDRCKENFCNLVVYVIFAKPLS